MMFAILRMRSNPGTHAKLRFPRQCPCERRSRGSKGQQVWEGVVHVFDVEGHPKATQAYAWSAAIDGSDKRRVYAVLEVGAIKAPLDAVRAAIVAEHREIKGE